MSPHVPNIDQLDCRDVSKSGGDILAFEGAKANRPSWRVLPAASAPSQKRLGEVNLKPPAREALEVVVRSVCFKGTR
jgi:hypothetical protein